MLYPHYATLGRTWGPAPIEDQALAGGIMWAGGDAVFLIALVAAVAVWLRSEEAATERVWMRSWTARRSPGSHRGVASGPRWRTAARDPLEPQVYDAAERTIGPTSGRGVQITVAGLSRRRAVRPRVRD